MRWLAPSLACQLPGRVVCQVALAAAMALGPVGATHALSLAEAFELARVNDAAYRAGSFDVEVARQAIPIARSALLPQVALNHNQTGYNGTRSFPNALQQEVTTRLDYAAPSTTLSMRMPLFNYDAWNRLDQATAQSKGAEASQRARGLDLVNRLTVAYLQALEARATLSLSEAEVTALEEQTRRAEQRFRRGEGTRIEEAQARASLELARARVSDARERVGVGLARLQRITGQSATILQDTPADFVPGLSEPDALQRWTNIGALQNPAIEVREAAVESARFAIKRSQAGHLPRLDLVANVTRSRNESLSNLDQSSHLRSVGVQFSLPLFNGFGVQATVRQSEAELSRAQEDLRNERENNEVEIRSMVQAADSTAERALALRRAVAASEVALTGALRAQDAGLLTLSDVLDARRNLYSTRRDLAQTHYDHLGARARLLALAGEPLQRIVEQINANLSTPVSLGGLIQASNR